MNFREVVSIDFIGLDTDFSLFETESKAWYPGLVVTLSDGERLKFTVYTIDRLNQSIRSGLEWHGMFYEGRLLIVDSVTKENMVMAVEKAAERGLFDPV